MIDSNINTKIKSATKWSTISVVVSKLVSPVVSMVLARLLAPEAFGVVATLTMIISFAEIFTDAGFQKYLIQHDFKDNTDRNQSTTVAFWSNFCMSLVIWGVTAIFCEPIAKMVGNPGLGYVIAIACVSIPLAAFSSIQMALYKRDFDFKTLFKVQLAGILVPIVITIPLALMLKSYWALVIGTIARDAINAILLTYYSTWKPNFYYSFAKLKEMTAFTIWTMIEYVSIWAASYLDVFIVGKYLDAYFLGIYKTSMATVTQITALITATVTPVIFSTLSRLQDDRPAFRDMYLKFQKFVGLLILPLGAGIFLYSDLLTSILLGDQWGEASGFIGLYGMTLSIQIVFSYISSESYRALGKPKLSLLVQILFLAAFIPLMAWVVKFDFKTLYIARSLIVIEMVVVNLTILYFTVKISTLSMIRQLAPAIIGTIIMAVWAYFIKPFMAGGMALQILSAISCTLVYFCVLYAFFSQEKALLLSISSKILKK